MEAARAGADRQRAARGDPRERDERVCGARRGEVNPLARLLADDERIVQFVDPAEVRAQLDPTGRGRRPHPHAASPRIRHTSQEIEHAKG